MRRSLSILISCCLGSSCSGLFWPSLGCIVLLSPSCQLLRTRSRWRRSSLESLLLFRGTFRRWWTLFLLFASSLQLDRLVERSVHLEESIGAFFLQHFPDLCLRGLVLLQVLRTTHTTAERERTLRDVSAGPRVGYIQRTVLAETIFGLATICKPSCVIVARIAEPPFASAIEEGHRAAKHALPVDKLGSMSPHAYV